MELGPTESAHELREGYVLVVHDFTPPDFKEVTIKAKALDTRGMLFAEPLPTEYFAYYFPDNPDRNFVQFSASIGDNQLKMGTSLEKYRIGLQHLMHMWRSPEDSRLVRLRVFGYLSNRGYSHSYYLKPFAIAQST